MLPLKMTASLFIMSTIIVDLGNAFPEPLTINVADFEVWNPAKSTQIKQ